MKKISLMFILACFVWAGCSHSKKVEKKIRSVKVAQVVSLNESSNKLILPATLNERRGVDLAFRVGGPLVTLNNIVGAYVKKGDVVASIDQRDFSVGLDKAESNYKLSKKEYERYKELLKRKSVSQSMFDQMEARYILAKGNYEDAKHAFEDTQIRAPYSGYIDRVYVENFQKVVPGQPIVSFIDLSSYKVTAWISADDVAKVGDDTRYVCKVKEADKTLSFDACFLELGSKSDFTKQSYPISVVIENTDGIKLRAGTSMLLELYSQDVNEGTSNVIPVTSLFTHAGNTCVWVLKNQKVELRNVQVDRVLSDVEVVVAKGLSNSEVIISAGANYLQQGEEVKIYKGFSKTNKGHQL